MSGAAIMEGVKTCVTCRKSLPASAFSFLAKSRDGLRSRCKQCDQAAMQTYRDRLASGQTSPRKPDRNEAGKYQTPGSVPLRAGVNHAGWGRFGAALIQHDNRETAKEQERARKEAERAG